MSDNLINQLFGTQMLDKSDNKVVFTPENIANDMVEMLPSEVFNPSTKFLDIYSKSGIFLKLLYKKLMSSNELLEAFPDKKERSDHILENQLYGLCGEQYSWLISMRAVYGTLKPNGNIRYIDNYKNLVKNKKAKEIVTGEFGENMRFDVVIGNPPYQDNNGGGANGVGGTTLYNKFIDSTLVLTDILCMITKNNWFQSEQLSDTRTRMIESGITRIINYPLIDEIFKGVSVAVSIFLIDKTKEYKRTHYTQIENGAIIYDYFFDIKDINYVPESKTEFNIVSKIVCDDKFENFEQHVLPNTPFGIRTNGIKSSGNHVIEHDEKSQYFDILLLYYDKIKYIEKTDVAKNSDIVDKYKIICGQQLNKNRSVITSIRGLEPNQVCTSSFGVLYYSDDKTIAYIAYKYINTQFFRFLAYCAIETVSTISPSRFKLVPDQDFTSTFKLDINRLNDKDYKIDKIDWIQPIDIIDKQLYKKYNLTQEEIDYIEKTIKPME